MSGKEEISLVHFIFLMFESFLVDSLGIGSKYFLCSSSFEELDNTGCISMTSSFIV